MTAIRPPRAPFARAALVATALAALFVAPLAALFHATLDAPLAHASARPKTERSAGVRCDGAIQHPLQVKAAALDPLVRGALVRVRVTTTSRLALEGGEVRLVSDGGAAIEGASRATFGPVSPGGSATRTFTVRLPAEGRRFLLQFEVRSDAGAAGLSRRGATLNLLPDGPADPGRVVTTNAGRTIVEHRARRLP
jgi:hypothetical protein